MDLFGESGKYNIGPNTTVPLPDNLRILKRNLMAASWVSILSAWDVIEIAQGAQIVSGLAIKEGTIPWILLVVVLYLTVSYSTLYITEYKAPREFARIDRMEEPYEIKKITIPTDTAEKRKRKCDTTREKLLYEYADIFTFKEQWLNKYIPIGLSFIAVVCLVIEIQHP